MRIPMPCLILGVVLIFTSPIVAELPGPAPTEPVSSGKYFLQTPDVITVKISGDAMPDKAKERIGGEHLIGPDGFITFGEYGRVYVNELTVEECKDAIHKHFVPQFGDANVSVEMYSYTSKDVYVIFTSDNGDQVVAFPWTEESTVVKLIREMKGFPPHVEPKVRLARAKAGAAKPEILPVDLSQAAWAPDGEGTNYRLEPNDRLFVQCASKKLDAKKKSARKSGKIAKAVRFESKDLGDYGLFLAIGMLSGADMVSGGITSSITSCEIDGVRFGVLEKKTETWLLLYGKREKVEQLAEMFEQTTK